MSTFSTQDGHSGRWHQPVSVPMNRTDAFQAACEMVEDLGWTDCQADSDALRLTCMSKGGFLSKPSKVIVWTEGPEGIPSSTTHCSSEAAGGLLSNDKSNVAEFMRKLYMRIT